jgi:predicted RND superfamily exporter protein
VSVSSAIHLLNAFLGARAVGIARREAIGRALQEVGVACGLAALTTMLGFFSLLVSPVPAVREFALLAGLGVGIAFAITIVGVPLALLAVETSPPPSTPTQGLIECVLERGLHWVLHHRSRLYIYLATLTVVLLTLPGLFRLREGTDIIRALKAKAPLRVSTEFIDQHLTGVNTLELIVDLPKTGLQPAFIRRVLVFSQALQAQPQVTSVHSPWEGLRSMQPERLADDQQLRVIATLLPLALPLDHWFNVNAKAFRMSLRTRAMGSDQFLDLAQQVKDQAESTGLPVQLTGTTYLLAQMSRTLVFTQLWSLGLAVVLILGTIALVLRSWRLGLLAAIPNLLPPLVVFGLMGWCGIGLSTATTMIASVALGLIVDDTIHLLYRYRRARRIGHGPPQAITAAIHQTGRALVITTLILTLGFWVGLIGSFKPTVSFSFLKGLTMILALLADLLILPSCLLSVRQTQHHTWS